MSQMSCTDPQSEGDAGQAGEGEDGRRAQAREEEGQQHQAHEQEQQRGDDNGGDRADFASAADSHGQSDEDGAGGDGDDADDDGHRFVDGRGDRKFRAGGHHRFLTRQHLVGGHHDVCKGVEQAEQENQSPEDHHQGAGAAAGRADRLVDRNSRGSAGKAADCMGRGIGTLRILIVGVAIARSR